MNRRITKAKRQGLNFKLRWLATERELRMWSPSTSSYQWAVRERMKLMGEWLQSRGMWA